MIYERFALGTVDLYAQGCISQRKMRTEYIHKQQQGDIIPKGMAGENTLGKSPSSKSAAFPR